MQGATYVAAYITVVEYPATTSLLYRYSTATTGLLEGGYPYPGWRKRDEAEHEERQIHSTYQREGTMKQPPVCQHHTSTLPHVESMPLNICTGKHNRLCSTFHNLELLVGWERLS